MHFTCIFFAFNTYATLECYLKEGVVMEYFTKMIGDKGAVLFISKRFNAEIDSTGNILSWSSVPGGAFSDILAWKWNL